MTTDYTDNTDFSANVVQPESEWLASIRAIGVIRGEMFAVLRLAETKSKITAPGRCAAYHRLSHIRRPQASGTRWPELVHTWHVSLAKLLQLADAG